MTEFEAISGGAPPAPFGLEKTDPSFAPSINRALPVVAVVFFFSGASALVFEIVWFKLLGLAFGSSHIAVSVVVAVFMAGLALGGFLAPRLRKSFASPLVAYAFFELTIGIYALFVPYLIKSFPDAIRMLGLNAESGDIPLTFVRIILASVALLLPTTLMGATLPVLSAALSYERGRVGGAVSLFYALNTFGAVGGVLAAVFLLLPVLGVFVSNLIAAGIDITIAAVLYVIISREKSRRIAPGQPAAKEPAEIVRFFLLVAFLAGFIALGYQMVWTRSLATILGSSIYGFAGILATFLFGIAYGSFAMWRKIEKIKKPVALLAALFGVIALSAYFSSLIIDRLPFLVLAISKRPDFASHHWILGQFGISAVVVILPTLAMGASFPLIVALTVKDGTVGGDLTKGIGVATAANTLGAILGSLLVGMAMIPALNLDTTVKLLVVGNFSLSFLVLLWGGKEGASTVYKPLALILASAAFVFAVTPGWNYARLTSGMFRFSTTASLFSSRDFSEPALCFHKDGLVATVTVERGVWNSIALKVNGKTDASSHGDMPTQILSGIIPTLIHPNPENVAVIGYGSGVTIGAVLKSGVKSLKAVELEPAVLAAARIFADFNNSPWKDKRLQEIADDGRSFLEMTDDRFDIIISEPSNPWMSGASNLFTLDFWRLALSRLKDDGIFCQWLQLYELSTDNVKALFNTFLAVFPEVMVFKPYADSNDTIVIGSKKPLSLDYLGWKKKATENPEIAAELARAGIASPSHIPCLFLTSKKRLALWTQGAKTVTDDNALIEFSAPFDLVRFSKTQEGMGVLSGGDGAFMKELSFVSHNFPLDDDEEVAHLAFSLLLFDRKQDAQELAQSALIINPMNELAKNTLHLAEIFGEEIYTPGWLIDDDEYDGFAEVRKLYKRGEYYKALDELESPNIPMTLFQYQLTRAFILLRMGAPYTALAVLDETPPLEGEYEKMWIYYLRGVAYESQRRNDKAADEYQKFLILHEKIESMF